MKSQLYLLFAVLFLNAGWGQEPNTKAEKNFQNYYYVDAAKEYERRVRKGDYSQETLQNLGDTYFYNSDMTNAVTWYAQLFSRYERTLGPEYIFRYVHALKGVGNYDLAKALMKTYAKNDKIKDFDVAHFQDNDLALDELKRYDRFCIRQGYHESA